jgi:TATA-binding protein-associated factor
VLRRLFPSVPYARLDGNTPAAQRSALAERFNAQQQGTAPPTLAQAQAQAQGQELRMLLVTTKACGVGLTLTAADTVIFVEHDWNPFVDLQGGFFA